MGWVKGSATIATTVVARPETLTGNNHLRMFQASLLRNLSVPAFPQED